MRTKTKWALALVAAGAAVAAWDSRNVLATPAAGFTGTTIAQGRFPEINVFNHLVTPALRASRQEEVAGDAASADVWLSMVKTRGLSDLYVQSNVWAPGGSTGWHSHPGHSLIIVTAGTVTAYEGGDPECKPTVYTAGMGFVDPGGNHVHILRNEGSVEARTIAVQLVPASATRRIDAPNPGGCSF